MPPGLASVVNMATVLAGTAVGVGLGNRLPARTRELVTDALGLVTLLIAATSAADVLDPALSRAVGSSAPMLIVLGSLLLGGIAGSLLDLEGRVARLGAWLQRRLAGPTGRADSVGSVGSVGSVERQRFAEGFVVASLVFCTGPLAILGALNDGLGNGGEQILLKSVLDGFAAIAFAASFGWGVAASVVTIAVVQGGLTLVGLALGDVLPDAELAAITATGGLLLLGVALRLLRIREIPVADLLPALLVAPLLMQVARVVHG